jgi:hypothetical protein
MAGVGGGEAGTNEHGDENEMVTPVLRHPSRARTPRGAVTAGT